MNVYHLCIKYLESIHAKFEHTFILYWNRWTTTSRSVNFKSLKATIWIPLCRQRLFIQCNSSWSLGMSTHTFWTVGDWLRIKCKWLKSNEQLKDLLTKSAPLCIAPCKADWEFWADILNNGSKGLALVYQISVCWANMALAASI